MEKKRREFFWRWRYDHAMTQEEVAAKIRTDATTIGALENGTHSHFGPKLRRRLADFYGIEIKQVNEEIDGKMDEPNGDAI